MPNSKTYVHKHGSATRRVEKEHMLKVQITMIWIIDVKDTSWIKESRKTPLKMRTGIKAWHEIVKLSTQMPPVHTSFTGWIKCTTPFKFMRNTTLFV